MQSNIAVIPGDGTGPEVASEGIKVLQAAASASNLKLSFVTYDFGGDRYLRTGELLPDSALEEIRGLDAIYLGAIGHPDVEPGVLEKGILLRLRFDLDQYINLRPVKLYPNVPTPLAGKGPEDIDFVVVRENTEGTYAGEGGFLRRGTPHEIATQGSVNTRKGVERAVRYAFDLAGGRRGHLTLVHKTNVLTFAGDLWERTFDEVAAEYPGVDTDYNHVDAACIHFVQAPERYDVIVTDNLFGDILTDLGGAVSGGIGLASSANLNPERTGPSMFEPVHGSAPDLAGQDRANPLAAILSVAMLFEHSLHAPEAAEAVRGAVERVLAAGHRTQDLVLPGESRETIGCHEMGDRVLEALRQAVGKTSTAAASSDKPGS